MTSIGKENRNSQCLSYKEQYVIPREVYCLWLYLKDSVLTLDQFSSRLERDRVVRVTTGVSVW